MTEMLDIGLDLDRIAIVKQLPVIVEHLEDVQKAVADRTNAAISLQATPDTVQSVKGYRADLNKEFAKLEDMRKAIKKAVMAPYEAFEATYKRCVADPYKKADVDLRSKIGAVESLVIGAAVDATRAYYSEACRARDINVVTYDRFAQIIGLRIGMTEAKQKTQPPKKVRDLIDSVLDSIALDLEAIVKMDNAGEIEAEYMRSFRLGEAVATVQQRHEEAERAAKAAAERAQRAQIEAERQKAILEYLPTPEIPILSPPVPVETIEAEEVFTVTFTATATRAKLIALREYMKENGIQYE